MNRKSILRLTAAAMTIASVQNLNQVKSISATELPGRNNDEILSDSKEDIRKSEVTTGQAVNIENTEIQEAENVECIDVVKVEEKKGDTSLLTIEPIILHIKNIKER